MEENFAQQNFFHKGVRGPVAPGGARGWPRIKKHSTNLKAMNQSSAQYLQKARKLAASGKLREALDLCLKAAAWSRNPTSRSRRAASSTSTAQAHGRGLDWLKTIIASIHTLRAAARC